ncbi:hypothetical protein Holit_00518 [Hollandina sp. SP2]
MKRYQIGDVVKSSASGVFFFQHRSMQDYQIGFRPLFKNLFPQTKGLH